MSLQALRGYLPRPFVRLMSFAPDVVASGVDCVVTVGTDVSTLGVPKGSPIGYPMTAQ